ncbi:MAG: co-chaperone protein HscB, molecular chaperone HscB [Candidatus Rokubacteria bacterium CSP1-6]|nr:MAG: co-chaperone protein HscB, molecular chaperone HscB [Candidatus Rokubacteria bacterium CSP1-6]
MTRSARDLCWNCQSEVGGEYFCPQCVKVQPASVWSDYFDVFGLPRKLGLDLEELQRRFYDWSRKFHPDLFQRATPEEQAISLENSALVNTAYRTLRDPIARVEYLIGLEEGAVKGIPPKAPLDLLEEMLLVQEALEGAKASALDAQTQKRLTDERARLAERRRAEEERLLDVSREWDALVEGSSAASRDRDDLRRKLLDRMKGILAVRAYLTTVINDLSDALGEDSQTHVSHRRH